MDGDIERAQRVVRERFGEGRSPSEELIRERREELAIEIALETTHEVRGEMERGLDREERLPAPSPEEVRRRRREERRKREDASRRPPRAPEGGEE